MKRSTRRSSSIRKKLKVKESTPEEPDVEDLDSDALDEDDNGETLKRARKQRGAGTKRRKLKEGDVSDDLEVVGKIVEAPKIGQGLCHVPIRQVVSFDSVQFPQGRYRKIRSTFSRTCRIQNAMIVNGQLNRLESFLQQFFDMSVKVQTSWSLRVPPLCFLTFSSSCIN
jgi:hypothetical protein